MASNERFLLTGANGWICGQIHALLESQGKTVHSTTVRMEDLSAMSKVFDDFQPTRVINCAGKTGRPNVDWCEDHRDETVMANVVGTLMLAHLCHERGVHMTNMATGCIYTSDYTSDRSQIVSKPFTENDQANFNGSFYSATKAPTEWILRNTYPNTVTLRVRMPISDDLHPRSFVTKITKYEHVVNIPNSNTILHEMLPLAIAMSEHGETGVYNFTNPGAVSHNEVLGLYKQIVDPEYSWKNCTLEQQAGVIKADRSNCELDTTKLMGVVKQYQGEEMEIEVNEIREAYAKCFESMKRGMQAAGGAGA